MGRTGCERDSIVTPFVVLVLASVGNAVDRGLRWWVLVARQILCSVIAGRFPKLDVVGSSLISRSILQIPTDTRWLHVAPVTPLGMGVAGSLQCGGGSTFGHACERLVHLLKGAAGEAGQQRRQKRREQARVSFALYKNNALLGRRLNIEAVLGGE